MKNFRENFQKSGKCQFNLTACIITSLLSYVDIFSTLVAPKPTEIPTAFDPRYNIPEIRGQTPVS